MPKIEADQRTTIEAAVFRRRVEHLRSRGDVQNIDLMPIAGFCRNCLANWYQDAAADLGHALSKDEVREIVYGMSYKDWQAQNQVGASAAQLEKFEASRPKDH